MHDEDAHPERRPKRRFRKRNILAALLLVVVGLAGALWLHVAPNLGGEHSAQDLARYARSPQFDAAQGRFVNHNQPTIDTITDRILSLATIRMQMSRREDLSPVEKLPEMPVDLDAFLDDSHSPNVIWLGHSSFMIRIAGKTLLIDPVFENAGPAFFLGRRFQISVLAREELPPVDYVLISHDHYDHLEAATVRYLASRDTRFIVPIGVGAHLREWGVPAARITEKDWWEEAELDGLKVVAAPAQHYSGRASFLANDTLWISFVIKSAQTSLYFSGDSGYGGHFAEIRDRHGPFDMVFLENGQYSPISREIHMHPEDVVDAFKDLGAKVLVPVHWAVFQLSRHPWYEPAQRIKALAEQNGIALFVPRMGDVITSRTERRLDAWWEPLVQRQRAGR